MADLIHGAGLQSTKAAAGFRLSQASRHEATLAQLGQRLVPIMAKKEMAPLVGGLTTRPDVGTRISYFE